MSCRILLAYAFIAFGAFTLNAQCPAITDIIAFNSVASGTDCTFSLEVGTDVTSNSANKSLSISISLADNTPVLSTCIGSLSGASSSAVINNITLPCDTDLSTLQVSFQGYDGNGGCSSNGGANNCAPGSFPAENIQGALPVEITSFQATKERFQQIQLEWVTVSEENNAMFAVEHSTDGRNFEEIAKVEGNGNSVTEHYYSYMDKFPESGLNYYRLKQIDFDGTFEYSEVISVEVEKNTDQPLAIANSLAKSEITLIFNDNPTSNAVVEVFNTNGNLLYQTKINSETTHLTVDVDTYEPGMYFVRVPVGREYLVAKFIKVAE